MSIHGARTHSAIERAYEKTRDRTGPRDQAGPGDRNRGGAEDDVLLLTEMVTEDGSVVSLANDAADAPEADPPVFDVAAWHGARAIEDSEMAAAIALATGSSFTTMGLLMPLAITITYSKLAVINQAGPHHHLMIASIGAVLAGAIFGDHCSPISDTTVLSSIASGCTLEEHVWTQLPYALLTATVAMLAGDTLCSKLGLSPWLGLGIGVVLLFAVVRLLGKPVPKKVSG